MALKTLQFSLYNLVQIIKCNKYYMNLDIEGELTSYSRPMLVFL